MPRHRVGILHLAFLGGLSLMTFSVGTMVVLSHADQAALLRRPLWVFHPVQWGVLGAVAARLAAEIQPAFYFQWLAVASVSWLAAALSWLTFALPHVVRPVPAESFERIHEEAKRRLLKR